MNKKIQLFLFLCFSFFLLFFLTFHPVFAVSALEGISTLREISLEKNETLTLPVTAFPSSAHISSVSFRSVNPSIVKVTAQGQLTALSQGRANLWITASDSQNPPNIFKKRIRIFVYDSRLPLHCPSLTDAPACIVHRGLADSAPENTIPAFRLAREKGARYVECDIQETKDGVLILSHDSSLSRMCGIEGEISSLTWSEIRRYPVKGGVNTSLYPSSHLPSLKSFLTFCNRSYLIPVIEIKSSVTEKGLNTLNRLLKYSTLNPVVISDNPQKLLFLRKINSTVHIQYIIARKLSSADFKFCQANQFDLSVMYRYTTLADIKKAHRYGIKVAVSLFKDTTIIKLFLSWGADYLTCCDVIDFSLL